MAFEGFSSEKREQRRFELTSAFLPTGDQPQAIEKMTAGILEGRRHQTLLGVTGSGKTFSMANVIARVNKPTLVLAHNKTLVAQLYQEFKAFFPNNAVEYFVSYYDYYQPEAYVPSTDTYIEKDSQINETIDRMRHRATCSLLTRDDVIIVASVSCIYGIGSTDSYQNMTAYVEVNRPLSRDAFMRQLIESQYERNDIAFSRCTFRVRGDVVEVFPPSEEDVALRIVFDSDVVESITLVDPLRGKVLERLEHAIIWPASHYATTKDRLQKAIKSIETELTDTLKKMNEEDRLLEAQRLGQRTRFDLEMLETTGVCKGIENYSRHLTQRNAGDPPPTLLDYFPPEFLLVVDESHQTMPQVGAMYRGDRARKETLVQHGFRLPSALDNRPLKFDEFESFSKQAIYVSATPGGYEIEKSEGLVIEQLIRPTGLVDPQVEVRPVLSQVDDVIHEARIRKEANERVLVTTLTKRMSEDLTEYFQDVGIKAKYLHSDIDTVERTQLLKQLRSGVFDVLVGINLLREGLDLPEVSLVAILDADKEGFLRSTTGLIQTIGRAARHVNGKAILYADRITDSIRGALQETARRRTLQSNYNQEHGISPRSIQKPIHDMYEEFLIDDHAAAPKSAADDATMTIAQMEKKIAKLQKEMKAAAKAMNFELAAELRDQVHHLQHEIVRRQTL